MDKFCTTEKFLSFLAQPCTCIKTYIKLTARTSRGVNSHPVLK